MFVNIYVLILLQINALSTIKGKDLPDSTCSRIIATPNGKTEPMYILLYEQSKYFPVTIGSPNCKVNGTVGRNPCKTESDYINITIVDFTKNDQLLVAVIKGTCIANFVPKCIFKPVKTGNVKPQVSFLLARFANGENSLNVKFSINGSESNVKANLCFNSFLLVRTSRLCEWTGMKANSRSDSKYCSDFTKKEVDDRLDYTLEYELEEQIEVQEPVLISNFVFSADRSGIGVSVYWKRRGVP
nr:hypothetical transcript [Hymenolepis microstoma]